MTSGPAGDTGRRNRAPARALLRPGAFLPAILLALAVAGGLSCGDDSTAPDQLAGPGEPSMTFTLDGSTSFDFGGSAAWPPAGSGVIARMDSAGRTLQIAGYHQTSGKAGAFAGPEPRFDFLFIEIRDSAGIPAGTYSPAAALFCRDLAYADFDSMGYAGISGALTLTLVTPESLAGSFSLTAMRRADSAAAVISAGKFGAPWGRPLFMAGGGDSGGAGGTIQILADTGTTPVYTWDGNPVYALSVARTVSPAADVWGIVALGGDSITSGVRHGLVPAAAFLVADAESVLTRGVRYRVTVRRVGGAYGWREFTP